MTEKRETCLVAEVPGQRFVPKWGSVCHRSLFRKRQKNALFSQTLAPPPVTFLKRRLCCEMLDVCCCFPEGISARGRWSVFWNGLTGFSLCVMRALGEAGFCPVQNNKGHTHSLHRSYTSWSKTTPTFNCLFSFFIFTMASASKAGIWPLGPAATESPWVTEHAAWFGENIFVSLAAWCRQVRHRSAPVVRLPFL